MIERFFNVGQNASLDGDFRLHYGAGESLTLQPCQEIFNTTLCVGLVDNNTLNPRRLLLVDKDRTSISVYCANSGETRTLSYAGKSAFIDLDPKKYERAMLGGLVNHLFSKNLDRKDHLHFATVDRIRSVNWHVFWAPLQESGKVFHVRLVADRTLRQGDDPTEEDVVSLAGVFTRSC